MGALDDYLSNPLLGDGIKESPDAISAKPQEAAPATSSQIDALSEYAERIRPQPEQPDERDVARQKLIEQNMAQFRETPKAVQDILSNQQELISGARNDQGFIANVINAYKIGSTDSQFSKLLGKTSDPEEAQAVLDSWNTFQQRVKEANESGAPVGAVAQAFYDAAGSASYTIQNGIAGTLAASLNGYAAKLINKSAWGEAGNAAIAKALGKETAREAVESIAAKAVGKRAAGWAVAAAEPGVVGEAIMAGVFIYDVMKIIRNTSEGKQYGGGLSVPGVVAGFNKDFSKGQIVKGMTDAGLPVEWVMSPAGQKIANASQNIYAGVEAFNVLNLVSGPMSAVSSLANKAIAKSTLNASAGVAFRFMTKMAGGVVGESAEEGAQAVSQKIYLDKAVQSILKSDPEGLVYGAMLNHLREQPRSDAGDLLRTFAEESVRAIPSMMVLGLFGAPGSYRSARKEYADVRTKMAQEKASEAQKATAEERAAKIKGLSDEIEAIKIKNSAIPQAEWDEKDLQTYEANYEALGVIYAKDAKNHEDDIKQVSDEIQRIKDDRTRTVFAQIFGELYGTEEASKIVMGQLETEADVKEVLSAARKRAVEMGIDPVLVSEDAFNSAIRKGRAYSVEESVKREAASDEYKALKKIVTEDGFSTTRASVQKIREMLTGRVLQIADGEFVEITKETPNKDLTDFVIKRVAYIEERVGAFYEQKDAATEQGESKPAKATKAQERETAISEIIASSKASVGETVNAKTVASAYDNLTPEQKKTVGTYDEFEKRMLGKETQAEAIAQEGKPFDATDAKIQSQGLSKGELASLEKSAKEGSTKRSDAVDILIKHIEKRSEIDGKEVPAGLSDMSYAKLLETAKAMSPDAKTRNKAYDKAAGADRASVFEAQIQEAESILGQISNSSPEKAQELADKFKGAGNDVDKRKAVIGEMAAEAAKIKEEAPAAQVTAAQEQVVTKAETVTEKEAPALVEEKPSENAEFEKPDAESYFSRREVNVTKDTKPSIMRLAEKIKDADDILPESGFRGGDGKAYSSEDILNAAYDLSSKNTGESLADIDGFPPKAFDGGTFVISSIPHDYIDKDSGKLNKDVSARWVYLPNASQFFKADGGRGTAKVIALQLQKASYVGKTKFYNVAVGLMQNDGSVATLNLVPGSGMFRMTSLGETNIQGITIDGAAMLQTMSDVLGRAGLKGDVKTLSQKEKNAIQKKMDEIEKRNGVSPRENWTEADRDAWESYKDQLTVKDGNVARLPGKTGLKLIGSFKTKESAAEEWRNAAETSLPQFEVANGRIGFSGNRQMLTEQALALLNKDHQYTKNGKPSDAAAQTAINKLSSIYRVPKISEDGNGGYAFSVQDSEIKDLFGGGSSLIEMAGMIVNSDRKRALFSVFESLMGGGATQKGESISNLNVESILGQILKQDVLKKGGKDGGTVLLNFLKNPESAKRDVVWRELTKRISSHIADVLESTVGNKLSERIVGKIESINSSDAQSAVSDVLLELDRIDSKNPNAKVALQQILNEALRLYGYAGSGERLKSFNSDNLAERQKTSLYRAIKQALTFGIDQNTMALKTRNAMLDSVHEVFGISMPADQKAVEASKKGAAKGIAGPGKFAEMTGRENVNLSTGHLELPLSFHRRLVRETGDMSLTRAGDLTPYEWKMRNGKAKAEPDSRNAIALLSKYIRSQPGYENATDEQIAVAAKLYDAERQLSKPNLNDEKRDAIKEEVSKLGTDPLGTATNFAFKEMLENGELIAAERKITMATLSVVFDKTGPFQHEFKNAGINVPDASARFMSPDDAMDAEEAAQAQDEYRMLAAEAERQMDLDEAAGIEAERAEQSGVSYSGILASNEYRLLKKAISNPADAALRIIESAKKSGVSKNAVADYVRGMDDRLLRLSDSDRAEVEPVMKVIREYVGVEKGEIKPPSSQDTPVNKINSATTVHTTFESARDDLVGRIKASASSPYVKEVLKNIDGDITAQKLKDRIAVAKSEALALNSQIEALRRAHLAAQSEARNADDLTLPEAARKANEIGAKLNEAESIRFALKKEASDISAMVNSSIIPKNDGTFEVHNIRQYQDLRSRKEVSSDEYKKNVESTLQKMGMPFTMLGEQYVVTAPNGAKFTIDRTGPLFDPVSKQQKAGVTVFSEQAAIQIATFGSDHTTLPHELAEYAFVNILSQTERDTIAKSYGIKDMAEAGHKWASAVEDMDVTKHSPAATHILAKVVNLFRTLLGFNRKSDREFKKAVEERKRLSRMFISGQLTQSAEERTGRSRVTSPTIEQVRAMSDVELNIRFKAIKEMAKEYGVPVTLDEEKGRRSSKERFVSNSAEIYAAIAQAKMAKSKEVAQFIKMFSGPIGKLMDGMTYLELLSDYDSTGVVRTIVDDFRIARETESAALKNKYKKMVVTLGPQIDEKFPVVIQGKTHKLSADAILSLKMAWADPHTRTAMENGNYIDLAPGAMWKHSVKTQFKEADYMNLPAIKGEAEFLASVRNSMAESGKDLYAAHKRIVELGGGLGIRPDDKLLTIPENYWPAHWEGVRKVGETNRDRGTVSEMKERAESVNINKTLMIHPLSEVINGHSNFVSDFVGSGRQTIALRKMLSGTDPISYGVGDFTTLDNTLKANGQRDVANAFEQKLRTLFENIESTNPSAGDWSSNRFVKAIIARQDIYRLTRPTTLAKMAGSVLIAPVYMKDAANLRRAMSLPMSATTRAQYDQNAFQANRASSGIQPWLSGTAGESQGRIDIRGKKTMIDKLRGLAGDADQLAMRTIFQAAAYEMLPEGMPRTNSSIEKMASDEVYWAKVREHANMLTAKTQSSALPELRGEIYNNKNLIIKMLTRYGTQQNRILNMAITEYFRAKANPTVESVERYRRTLSYGVVLNSVAMAAIGVGGSAFTEFVKEMIDGDDDDEILYESEIKRRNESKAIKMAKETVKNAAGMVEGMDEAWAAIEALKSAMQGDKSAEYMANRALMNRFVGSEMKAALDMSRALAEMKRLAQKEEEEGFMSDSDAKWYAFNAEKAQKSAITTFSFLLGVPGSGAEQLLNTARAQRVKQYRSALDNMYMNQ